MTTKKRLRKHRFPTSLWLGQSVGVRCTAGSTEISGRLVQGVPLPVFLLLVQEPTGYSCYSVLDQANCHSLLSAFRPGIFGLLDLHQVKAHDERAFAASRAFHGGGVSLDQILLACHWKSHNTFTQFYLKDLA